MNQLACGGSPNAFLKGETPYVPIVVREGRRAEQRREMVRAGTEGVVLTTGTKPESVHIIVRDLPAPQLAREGILTADRT